MNKLKILSFKGIKYELYNRDELVAVGKPKIRFDKRIYSNSDYPNFIIFFNIKIKNNWFKENPFCMAHDRIDKLVLKDKNDIVLKEYPFGGEFGEYLSKNKSIEILVALQYNTILSVYDILEGDK